MTIDAIQERCDECGDKFTRAICAIDLEHIIESMIADGIARHKKGGNAHYIAGIRNGS